MAWKRSYETAKGTRYLVRWRDAAGKTHSKSFVRSKDADQWMLEHTRREQLGDLFQEKPQTFGEFAGLEVQHGRVLLTGDGWFERYSQSGIRPATIKRRKDSRGHLHDFLDLRIDQLTPALIEDTLVPLAGKHPRTAKVVFETLQMILRSAKLRGQKVNPQVLEMDAPTKYVPGTKRFLSRKEVDAYAEKSDDPHLILLLSLTGLRLGEALALQDGDIRGGSVHVNHSLSREGVREALKTSQSRRIVPLPKEASRLISAAKLKRPAAGAPWLFPAPRGGPWRSRSNFYKRWNAKTPDLNPHTLRHTYASFMIAAGVHPKALQELMGHKSIAVTMDTYGHLFEGAKRESVDRLEKWMAEEAKRDAGEGAGAVGEGG